MDTVIEVKGSVPTVTVSWEVNKEGEADDTKKSTNPNGLMMGSGKAVYKSPLHYNISNFVLQSNSGQCQ